MTDDLHKDPIYIEGVRAGIGIASLIAQRSATALATLEKPQGYGERDRRAGMVALQALADEIRKALVTVAILAPPPPIIVDTKKHPQLVQRLDAIAKGYVGEACPDCANFTLVRNGTCLKCDTCGSTTGCS